MNIISTVQVWTRGPQRLCLPGTEQTEVTCVQEGSSDRGVVGDGPQTAFHAIKIPPLHFPSPFWGPVLAVPPVTHGPSPLSGVDDAVLGSSLQRGKGRKKLCSEGFSSLEAPSLGPRA